jgi:hypothetical protein
LVEPLFFFGAGASRPFDIPTMKEMVSEFQRELGNTGSHLYHNSAKEFRDELRLYDEVATSLADSTTAFVD